MDITLPAGFSLRAPTMDDAVDVAALLTACGKAEGEVSGVDTALVAADWRQDNFDLARDAVLVFAPDGMLAAAGELFADGESSFEIDGCVLPAFTGLGIGTALLAWIEELARGRIVRDPDGTISLSGASNSANGRARRTYEKAGFTPVRYFLHMHRKFDTPPVIPALPDGIRLRRFKLGRDERTMYETMEEAFEDHWEHTPAPYEEWLERKLDPDAYDTTLWFIAEAEGEAVGVVLPRYRGGLPWIQGLGVRRPWRGRGLGLALLQQAFAEFYARGGREVALNVDADSPTGATRLYERAEMSVASRFDLMRKTLRDS